MGVCQYLAAYEPDHARKEWRFLFSVVIQQDEHAERVCRMLANMNPRLRWATKDGVFAALKPAPFGLRTLPNLVQVKA